MLDLLYSLHRSDLFLVATSVAAFTDKALTLITIAVY
jgi:hypothetical protein